jgi:hypothetical protein
MKLCKAKDECLISASTDVFADTAFTFTFMAIMICRILQHRCIGFLEAKEVLSNMGSEFTFFNQARLRQTVTHGR